jgi:hypothetical protein
MKVEPSGVVMMGICDIQTPKCSAVELAAITAVWTTPSRSQINVCRECIEEMIRSGQWEIPNAKISRHIDVAAVDSNNRLILAIEVKRRPFYDRNIDQQVIKIHRNLLSHGAFPGNPFFMVIFVPTPAFLWTPENFLKPESQPDLHINISDEIEGIIHSINGDPDTNPKLMEEVVAKWVNATIDNLNKEEMKIPEWLLVSGLSERLGQAKVYIEYKM